MIFNSISHNYFRRKLCIFFMLLHFFFFQEKAFVVHLQKKDGSLGLSVSVSSLFVTRYY